MRCPNRQLVFQNPAVLFILKIRISDQAFTTHVIRNMGKKAKLKLRNSIYATILILRHNYFLKKSTNTYSSALEKFQ